MDEFRLFSEYFLVRFLINIAAMVALIRFIYYPIYRNRELFFTFFLLNFIVFLLAFMLEKAKAFNSLGSAFGLLAAFSLLRFRTETLTAKDMTYLFIIMAVGVINSIMKGNELEIIGLNALGEPSGSFSGVALPGLPVGGCQPADLSWAIWLRLSLWPFSR